jgi:hypothetical protein
MSSGSGPVLTVSWKCCDSQNNTFLVQLFCYSPVSIRTILVAEKRISNPSPSSVAEVVREGNAKLQKILDEDYNNCVTRISHTDQPDITSTKTA